MLNPELRMQNEEFRDADRAKPSLDEDLERFGRMAFVRAADCTGVIRRFHELRRRRLDAKVRSPKSSASEDAGEHPDYGLVEEVYRWMFVPLSVWPMDLRGLCAHLLEVVASGERVDEGTRMLCSFLPEPPTDTVCGPIGEYEQAVKAGSYESLINAQFKFDSMEEELARNEEFKADWERLKGEFRVDEHRNANGIVRRRMVQERNFRPSDWRFSWGTEAERFQNVFDAFCHRWNLYGMEGEKPLLLKLSVNLTPFSTLIEVPKYWSFDPKRDLKWGAVTKLHRIREVKRQGPKLSPGRSARRDEAERAKRFWEEASQAGLRGDRRKQWVMGRLGWNARTDESKLRRLLGHKTENTGKKNET
jgi:hypothetical protein